jgi:hypothetical protein
VKNNPEDSHGSEFMETDSQLSKSFFTFSDGAVIEHSEEGSSEIFRATHAYNSKLAFT